MPAQKMIVRPENHRKSVTSLTFYRSKSISDVNELKRRINSEWTALSHTVIECAVGEWRSIYVLAFVLKAAILSAYCNIDDVR